MVDLLFTDLLTGEIFEIRCYVGEKHIIENLNTHLKEWCEGRTFKKEEIY